MYFFNYDEPLFRPPSEARSLIFQITIGCSQNSCKFCGMYKMKQFKCRTESEIFAEIESIPQHYHDHIQRVFLGDGDGLVYPFEGLVRILEKLNATFPRLTRVSAYASPNSMTTKSSAQLQQLKKLKLRILYFGLESGDEETLQLVNKGFSPASMYDQCHKVQGAGIKLSVTAILGLAGRQRSKQHAVATAEWINRLSPQYFSLLTMFRRHNDDYFTLIEPLSNGEVLQEALLITQHLKPQRTILRSNHVSNILHLEGSFPKDREKIIAQAEKALAIGQQDQQWFQCVPDYEEEYF